MSTCSAVLYLYQYLQYAVLSLLVSVHVSLVQYVHIRLVSTVKMCGKYFRTIRFDGFDVITVG
jgi:hypothetical protein